MSDQMPRICIAAQPNYSFRFYSPLALCCMISTDGMPLSDMEVACRSSAPSRINACSCMQPSQAPIIRIKPCEIHVSDPTFYDEIYTNTTRKRGMFKWWMHLDKEGLLRKQSCKEHAAEVQGLGFELLPGHPPEDHHLRSCYGFRASRARRMSLHRAWRCGVVFCTLAALLHLPLFFRFVCPS
jgi:hypothetical protein